MFFLNSILNNINNKTKVLMVYHINFLNCISFYTLYHLHNYMIKYRHTLTTRTTLITRLKY